MAVAWVKKRTYLENGFRHRADGLSGAQSETLDGTRIVARRFQSGGAGAKVFEAPFVVVSHGTEADPVLNYGNAAALALWEMSWEELTRTPSRLTAEAPNREERAKLLEAVTRRGFIDDYSGVRISKTGRRFAFPARRSGIY
jgi:hypothetical protein